MRESERQKLMVLLKKATPTDEVLEIMKPRRMKVNGHEVPEGGIGIRQAARKYDIPRSTLSRWASRGLVKILLRTKNWLYIDEDSLKIFLNNSTN